MKSKSTNSYKTSFLALFSLALLIMPETATAQLTGTDTAAGDSCAGFEVGATRLTADSGEDITAVTLLCDGSVWQKIDIKLQDDSSACTGTNEGSIRYNSSAEVVQICDGTVWAEITATPSGGTPSNLPDGNGYFVITDGKWDGNLVAAAGVTGGNDAANALCLDDLTNNDWMGKSDAQTRGLINADNVTAFICGRWECNGALPATTYNFAVSGDATVGGASFVTDSNGYGPGNSQNWSGANYFNGVKEYWSNRTSTDSTKWSNSPNASYIKSRCEYSPGWSGIEVDDAGAIGTTNATGGDRWGYGGGFCHVPHHLVCFVHP